MKLLFFMFISMMYSFQVFAAATCDGDLSSYEKVCIELGGSGIKHCGNDGGDMVVTCTNDRVIIVRRGRFNDGYHEAIDGLKVREENYE